jgi:hypothetical protein
MQIKYNRNQHLANMINTDAPIDNIDWPLKWRFGNRNDKRASRGFGENYVAETGKPYVFAWASQPHGVKGRTRHPLTLVRFKFAPHRMPYGHVVLATATAGAVTKMVLHSGQSMLSMDAPHNICDI